MCFSSVFSRRHGRQQQEAPVREEVGGESVVTVTIHSENLSADRMDRSGKGVDDRLAVKKIDIEKNSTTALILQQRPRLAVIFNF